MSSSVCQVRFVHGDIVYSVSDFTNLHSKTRIALQLPVTVLVVAVVKIVGAVALITAVLLAVAGMVAYWQPCISSKR